MKLGSDIAQAHDQTSNDRPYGRRHTHHNKRLTVRYGSGTVESVDNKETEYSYDFLRPQARAIILRNIASAVRFLLVVGVDFGLASLFRINIASNSLS